MGPSVDQRFCKKKKRVKFWGKLRVFWGFSFFSLAFFAFFFLRVFCTFWSVVGRIWGGFRGYLGHQGALRVAGPPVDKGLCEKLEQFLG